MKSILMVVMAFSMTFSANKATKPYTFSTGAIRSSEVNKNFDSIYTKFNSSIDTLNKGVPRWSTMLYNKDSTWRYMNIDTIFGKVQMDTIVDADTVYSKSLKVVRAMIDTIVNSVGIFSPAGFVPGFGIKANGCLGFGLSQGEDKKAYLTLADDSYMYFKTNDANTMRLGSNLLAYFYGNVTSLGLVQARGFTTNGRDTLNYEDTTFYDSLFGASYITRITVKLVKIGATITMYQAGFAGDISGSTSAEIRGVPSKYMPTTKEYNVPVIIYNNGAYQTGIAQVNIDGKIHILPQNFGNLDGGVCGLAGCTISWIK
jgi:hypothetical protein